MMREVRATKGKRRIPVRRYKTYRMLPIAPPEEKTDDDVTDGLPTTTDGQASVEHLVPDIRYWFTDSDGSAFVNPSKKHNGVQNVLEFKAVKKVELLTVERKGDWLTRIALPRPDLLAPKVLITKDKWSFENSVFRAYKRDTPKLLDACFEFDWKCGKIPSLLSAMSADRQNEIYQHLRQFYPHVKAVYKHFSSLAPAGGIVPCIGSNALADIVFNCPGLLDRANLNLSKVDLQFVSTNATRVQIKGLAVVKGANPDRFLVRYQFLELLVRLVQERHFMPGIKNKTTA